MIHPFSVFLSIEEIALIFIFIGVDDLALVGGLVVDPLPIVYCTTQVLQYSMAVLFIFYPITDILISIFVVICTFAVLLSVQPISFIFLTIGVGIYSKAIFPILVPFSIIDCSTFVVINSAAVFLAIEELSLVFFAADVDIDSVCGELVFFPVAHIDVFIGERINSLAASTILVLSDVFSAIGVGDLLVFGSETARIVEKLREELLSR